MGDEIVHHVSGNLLLDHHLQKLCTLHSVNTLAIRHGSGLKIMVEMSPIKMTGQLHFSSVKIRLTNRLF